MVFTLLLFFFDEGSHNLEGLFSKQNLGGLLFYFLLILGLAILLINILPQRLRKGQ